MLNLIFKLSQLGSLKRFHMQLKAHQKRVCNNLKFLWLGVNAREGIHNFINRTLLLLPGVGQPRGLMMGPVSTSVSMPRDGGGEFSFDELQPPLESPSSSLL